MLKKALTLLLIINFLSCVGFTSATTIGIHGIQGLGTQKIQEREQENNTQIPIIGMIFDEYTTKESDFLTQIVDELGTGRVYHISISPFGYTASEVTDGRYDKSYQRFFEDIKRLNIKVIFRTMHEMNGGRYSRASHPEEFQSARRHVRRLARKKYNIQSDQLLFSLSFNSQDLPTTDNRPTQESKIEYCSERRIKTKAWCPRKIDYYPGDKYVDLIGFTLYNRGRSRPDLRSKRKSPQELLNEDGLIGVLEQRNKPIIIDELGTTAIKFEGNRSPDKAQEVFQTESFHKNERLSQRQEALEQHPLIKAMVYFNVDATAGASKQVVGQAERNIILSTYHKDYKEGIKLLTIHNKTQTIQRLFKKKKN